MNTKLMNDAKGWEAIMKLGFIETNDGSDDPRGIFRDIKKNSFHLYIDPWMDVFLSHNESDPIQLTINSLFDLQSAIDLIAGGIDEDGMIDGISESYLPVTWKDGNALINGSTAYSTMAKAMEYVETLPAMPGYEYTICIIRNSH